MRSSACLHARACRGRWGVCVPAECDGDDVLHSVLNVPRILAQVRQRCGPDPDLALLRQGLCRQEGLVVHTEDAIARGSSYRACGLVLTCGVSPPWHGRPPQSAAPTTSPPLPPPTSHTRCCCSSPCSPRPARTPTWWVALQALLSTLTVSS